LAQTLLVSRLALVGAGAFQRVALRRAVGEQFSGLVDHRNSLGL